MPRGGGGGLTGEPDAGHKSFDAVQDRTREDSAPGERYFPFFYFEGKNCYDELGDGQGSPVREGNTVGAGEKGGE